MDDMKKLIEKYKQELMAYRKAAEPKPNPSFTYYPENAPNAQQTPQAHSAPDLAEAPQHAQPKPAEKPADKPANKPADKPRKPQIIGYADDGDVEKLYEGIFGSGESAPEGDAPHAEDVPQTEGADFDIFNFTGSDNAAVERNERSEPSAQPGAPNEPNAQPSAPDERPQSPELIAEPEELFSPMFSEVPSFGEVQSDITEDSRPEDNTLPREPVSGVTSSAPTAPLPEAAQAQRVSPETAERLTEQPISGTDPDEQLTGRSFESDERPVNDPADIKPNGNGAPAVNYKESVYSSYADFERENTRAGQLRFRTFTARGALPVKDAVCVVTKDFGEETQVLSTQTTDMSGQTEIISLPAPPRSLSQSPDSTIQPYALYDATIRAKGYEGVVLKNIPIFEGILSVQNAALVPLAPEEKEGDIGETIDETAVGGGE